MPGHVDRNNHSERGMVIIFQFDMDGMDGCISCKRTKQSSNISFGYIKENNETV